MLAKVREYLKAGVRAVWVVYPDEADIHIFDAATPGQSRHLGRARCSTAVP